MQSNTKTKVFLLVLFFNPTNRQTLKKFYKILQCVTYNCHHDFCSESVENAFVDEGVKNFHSLFIHIFVYIFINFFRIICNKISGNGCGNYFIGLDKSAKKKIEITYPRGFYLRLFRKKTPDQ